MHKLNQAEAGRYLRKFLDSGKLLTSSHARESMKERSFYMLDVQNVIEHGKIRTVSFDETFSNYKIEIRGNDLEGDKLTFQLGLDIENESIILITGY